MTNEELNTLLMRVSKRAENAPDEVLRDSFVPVPALLAQLEVPEHHVLFGRRGTGKTHWLRFLQARADEAGALAVYVDLRKIGSPDDVAASSAVDFAQRCSALLIDVIEHIHARVYDAVIADRWSDRLEEISVGLDALAAAATQIQVVGEAEIER
jgi:Cdc6-like AAA superfamily ATPase